MVQETYKAAYAGPAQAALPFSGECVTIQQQLPVQIQTQNPSSRILLHAVGQAAGGLPSCSRALVHSAADVAGCGEYEPYCTPAKLCTPAKRVHMQCTVCA